MEVEWTLEVGDRIVRRDLHAKYGGSWYGGIEPSAKSPNVLLFTSATAGAEFGYAFDGWHSDGTFHYTGDGQVGDQLMKGGNRAVRDHLKDGRALRLFEKDGTDVTYVGEFAVPNESYVLVDEAPDRNHLDLRSVFVFRLRPTGPTWQGALPQAPEGEFAVSIPLERSNVDGYIIQRAAVESITALRSEAALVNRYVGWLEKSSGVTVERQAIPTAAGHLMYTDIYVRETRELIEAKASSSRNHIRAALGQILDYSRYVDHSSLAVLTPTRPAIDLIHLLLAHGIASIWETDIRGVFEREQPSDPWHDTSR